MNFYKSIEKRRTIYNINNEVIVPLEKVQEIVEHSLKHVPTAFNSQSNRAVVLFENAHNELWETVKESLRKIVPADSFAQTEEKIDSFKSGYGTILYFEDLDVIHSLQKQYAAYSDNFPIWSQQSSGMLQFAVWNLLEIEGLGVSLQHYTVFIENFIREKWNIPNNWNLIAQMPFGNPIGKPDEKQYNDLKDSFKIIK